MKKDRKKPRHPNPAKKETTELPDGFTGAVGNMLIAEALKDATFDEKVLVATIIIPYFLKLIRFGAGFTLDLGQAPNSANASPAADPDPPEAKAK